MIVLLWIVLLAPAPQPRNELTTTFYLLAGLVVVVGVFLWVVLSRFNRPL